MPTPNSFWSGLPKEREAARKRPGIVLALADRRRLLGGVVEPAAIDAHHRSDADIAAERIGLVLELGCRGRGAADVGLVVEAGDVDHAAVPGESERVRGVAIVLPGDGIVAGARALELVARARHELAELLLVDHAAVPARAGRARCVVDQLLEVVGVGPAALLVVHLAVGRVRVAPVAGKVARQRVLPAGGQLA